MQFEDRLKQNNELSLTKRDLGCNSDVSSDEIQRLSELFEILIQVDKRMTLIPRNTKLIY